VTTGTDGSEWVNRGDEQGIDSVRLCPSRELR
jgi:hypothetical protein